MIKLRSWLYFDTIKCLVVEFAFIGNKILRWFDIKSYQLRGKDRNAKIELDLFVIAQFDDLKLETTIVEISFSNLVTTYPV